MGAVRFEFAALYAFQRSSIVRHGRRGAPEPRSRRVGSGKGYRHRPGVLKHSRDVRFPGRPDSGGTLNFKEKVAHVEKVCIALSRLLKSPPRMVETVNTAESNRARNKIELRRK